MADQTDSYPPEVRAAGEMVMFLFDRYRIRLQQQDAWDDESAQLFVHALPSILHPKPISFVADSLS